MSASRDRQQSKRGQSSAEVRNALAALRANKLKQASSNKNKEQDDPFGTRTPQERRDLEDEENGLQSTSSLVAAAAATGKLNLSNRKLAALPAQVIDLLPPGSEFHPGNETSRSKAPAVDFSLSRNDSDARWYETKPLLVLKAADNIFQIFQEEITGFDRLEQLDLHGNLISKVPDAVVDLHCLTVLNLSHNKLGGSIPIAILGLSALTSLDLSHNQLTSLWPETWKTSLEQIQSISGRNENAEISPDSSGASDFWAKFPSAAETAVPGLPELDRVDENAPLPRLRNLNLSHNKLKNQALTDVALPLALLHIDLSHNALVCPLPYRLFAPLCDLATLNLAFNGLSDSDSLLDHLTPADGSQFLPKLRSLDMASNGLDTLTCIQAYFAQRQVSLIGLPKSLANYHPTQKQGDDVLQINVAGNFLRDEMKRIRGMGVPATHSSIADTNDSDEDAFNNAFKKKAVVHDEGTSSRQISEARAPAQTSKINLHLTGRSLIDENLSSAMHPPTDSIEAIDLSRNALTIIPLSVLEPCHGALRSLDVSRNLLSNFPDPGLTFRNLETLALANNRLAEASTIFSRIAQAAPQLKTLDLSLNLLSTLSGVNKVLENGLKALRLSGNRIDSLSAIAEMAASAKDGQQLQEWSCRELDFSDNAITRLQPELGFLPLDVFLVSGNVFRIPQRKVWEEGGTPGLLKWLRERV